MIWLMLTAGFICLYLVLMCPACSRKRKDIFFGKMWFAHRGLHDERVSENSLKAFALAAEKGYGIELDVRLTKDEQLVVFHDDTLQRLCGLKDTVGEMKLDQVKDVHLPDGQEIPTFEQAMGLIAGRVPVLIEIKSSPIGNCRTAEKVYEQLEAYSGPYAVQSFDPFQLRWFKKHAPDVIRGQLAQKARFQKPFRLNVLPQMMAGHLLFNRISVPDYVAYRQEDTKKFCYRMMRRVYRTSLAVWTVRSAAEADKMKDVSDAIIFENFCP